MNSKTHFFNKWVLLATGLFAILLFAMASQVPLNYWHHSKFSFAPDFAFNDFFPLITVFGSILGSVNAPVDLSNFQLYSHLAAFSLSLAFWLLFSLVQEKGFKALLVAVLVLLTQSNMLWWGAISINLSLSILGIAILIFAFNCENKSILINAILFIAAYFFMLGSSIFAWALLPVLVVSSFLYKKKWLASFLGIALAIALLFVSNTSLFGNITFYFENANSGIFSLKGEILRGKELGTAYSIWAILHNFNLGLVLISGAALLAFKNSDNKGSIFIGLVGIVLSLFAPLVIGIGGFALFILAIPLAFGAIEFHNWLAQKSQKLALPVVLALVLVFGFKGLTSWFTFSPYQYFQSISLFETQGQMIAEGEGEFLNMAGLSLLKSEIESAEKGDTLATNFYHNLENDKVEIIGVDYLKRDLRQFKKGVFVRLGLVSQVQKSGAFPPKSYSSAVQKNGFTLAIATSPNTDIKKAFGLYNKNQLGESIVKFKQLTDTFSAEPLLYFGLARAQFNFNTWDDALTTATVGIKKNPTDYKMLTLIGEIYRKQNKNKKALEYFNQSLAFANTYGRTHWMIGEYYLRNDSLEKAKSSFINAKYCPGPIALRAQKSLQLIDSLTKIEKFKSGLAPYFINRVNSFIEINDTSVVRLKSLIKQMDFYIDLDSTNAQLRAHQGIAFMMLQNFPRAAIKFEKALEINPNYPQIRQYMIIARTNWGARMFEKDSLEEAIFHFRYALDYSPNDESLKANLSVAYNEAAQKAFENEQLDDTYALIMSSIFYNQNNPVSFLQMGHLQEKINQTDSAEIAYNHAFKIDASHEETILTLIDFYRKKGDMYKVKVYEDRLNKVRRRKKGLAAK